MKISDMVSWLSELERRHGDVEVVIDDADTNWLFVLNETNIAYHSDRVERIEISVDYGDERFNDPDN